MTGADLRRVRVLRTTVALAMPFRNSASMHRALMRWKSLADAMREPGNRSTAPFLDTGEIMGGIRYVAKPGFLTLEVTKDDDALAAIMLTLAADTIKSDNSVEVHVEGITRHFEVSPSRSGPLLDVLAKSSMLTVNDVTPDMARLIFEYAIDAIRLTIVVLKGSSLQHLDDPSNQFRINAIVVPSKHLDAAGIVSFLEAWPSHRTMMHRAVEQILGIHHE